MRPSYVLRIPLVSSNGVVGVLPARLFPVQQIQAVPKPFIYSGALSLGKVNISIRINHMAPIHTGCPVTGLHVCNCSACLQGIKDPKQFDEQARRLWSKAHTCLLDVEMVEVRERSRRLPAPGPFETPPTAVQVTLPASTAPTPPVSTTEGIDRIWSGSMAGPRAAVPALTPPSRVARLGSIRDLTPLSRSASGTLS